MLKKSKPMLANKPNVLWIMADQLRPQALSCYADVNSLSPCLDRFASEGITCEMAVTNCPVCMPARAALVTSQYGHVNGVRVHGDFLPPDRRTVAHSFSDAGYRTSYVGKLHLASTNSNWTTGEEFWVHPSMRAGFEDFFGFDLSNHYYNTHYCTGDLCRGIKIDAHQTDGLTELSLDYLAHTAFKSGKPWFHVVSYEAPHPGGSGAANLYRPVPAPPEFEAMFDPAKLRLRPNVPDGQHDAVRQQAAGYYSMIAHLDHNIGRILDLVEQQEQTESTLVVFFADHGEMLGSHGRFHKQLAYDESIRIPLLLRWPGVIPPNARYDGIVSILDIYPTCAGFCGVAPAAEIQGLDHSNALLGMAVPPRAEALIQWLGETRYGWGDYPYRAIRTQRYTYSVSAQNVNERHGGHFRLLFDNTVDPYQLVNLFGAPDVKELQAALHVRLCQVIREAGEEVPEFVEEVPAEFGLVCNPQA